MVIICSNSHYSKSVDIFNLRVRMPRDAPVESLIHCTCCLNVRGLLPMHPIEMRKWTAHWWGSRTSNPVWGARTVPGGFDSHALPPFFILPTLQAVAKKGGGCRLNAKWNHMHCRTPRCLKVKNTVRDGIPNPYNSQDLSTCLDTAPLAAKK